MSKRNAESCAFLSFMALQLFASQVYCFGIKVSTNNRALLSFVCKQSFYGAIIKK